MLLFEAAPNLAGASDVLARLTNAELARVLAAGRTIQFRHGDVIFRQGDPHQGIFVLRSGRIRSFYVAPNGREITLAIWRAGNFVGGPEIFGGGTHVWSGVGVEQGEVLRLPGQAVRHLAAAIPSFAIGLIEGLAFKGKCYSALLQMLGTRSVQQRLALLLLNLADERGKKTPRGISLAEAPSHEELAAMVGATRQWVSMTIERLRRLTIVEVQRPRLTILNPSALRRLAEGD